MLQNTLNLSNMPSKKKKKKKEEEEENPS